MNSDRFKNFEKHVCELVLAFEKQKDGNMQYFDVDQLEVIADYYLEVYDVEGLNAAVAFGEQLFPASSSIRLRKAHLLSVQGQYPQALAILRELETTEPDNTDVNYALGAIYGIMGKSDMAIENYLKAASDGYQLDMIYGNVGDEYFKKGDAEKAIEYYHKSIDVNPEEERSMYNLACTLDEQGRDEEAEAYFSQLVSDHPYSKCAWYCLGSVYSWLQLYEKAADAFEYAIAIDKTMFNAYLGLSENYRRMGDMSRAVQALHDSLPYADDRPYVVYSIGRLYLEMGNCHTASTYFHDALKEDPAFALAWNDLGRCSERLGYVDEAAGYYRRAIDLDPDSDEHWVCLADLYMSTERYAEAAALLESARTEAVNRFMFDSRLLYCYFKLGRRNKLFALLQQDAHDFASRYNTLFTQYPDFSQDLEVVNSITSLSSI